MAIALNSSPFLGSLGAWNTSGPAPAVLFGRRFKVMSWNVQNFKAEDPDRTTGFKQLIASEDPDIILFQEVNGRRALTKLNKLFNGTYPHIRYVETTAGSGRGFMSKQDFTPFDLKKNNYRDGRLRAFTNALPQVTYSFPTESGKVHMDVLNAHFKAPLDTKAYARRARDVRNANELVEGYIRNKGNGLNDRKLLLIGDFNTDPGSGIREDASVFRVFKELGLKDTRLERRDASHVTGLRLDHAMASPGLFQHMIRKARVAGDFGCKTTDEAGCREISDHLPIVVEFDTEQIRGQGELVGKTLALFA